MPLRSCALIRSLTRAEVSAVTRRATQAKLRAASRRAAICSSVVCASSGSVWTIAASAWAAACLSSISLGTAKMESTCTVMASSRRLRS